MNVSRADGSPLRWFADALTLLSVVLLFCVSAMALTAMGISYDTAGGNILQKLHPASYAAALALAVNFLARPDRFRWLASLPDRFPGAAYFAAMWIAMILYAAVVQQQPMTPLIDSFLCAVVFLILYTDADDRLRRTIRVTLHAILFVNACIGVGEFVTHWRLTPYVTGGRVILHDYRSTALLGHPLINSSAAAGYILMLFFGGDRSIGPLLRTALIGVQAVALVAFGGRTAIVLCVALVALGGVRPVAELLGGRRFDMRLAAAACVAAPILLLGLFALVEKGDLNALIDRFVNDQGSARARVVMFQLFDYFSLDELLFGPDPARLTTIQNSLGIEYGIENSWIGLLFEYGALMSFFFILSFAGLVWEFWRRSSSSAVLLVIYLVIQNSSSAGISVKTLMFDQFVILMLAVFGQQRASERAPERVARAFAFAPGRA